MSQPQNSNEKSLAGSQELMVAEATPVVTWRSRLDGKSRSRLEKKILGSLGHVVSSEGI